MLGNDSAGLWPRAPWAQDAFRRDDQVDAEVVIRLWQRPANYLQRMHGGPHGGALVDAAQRAAQRELQIRIAAALADAATVAGNGNRSGNDQVDVRQIAGIDGATFSFVEYLFELAQT